MPEKSPSYFRVAFGKFAFPQIALLEQNLQIRSTPCIRANAERDANCQPIQLSKNLAPDRIETPHSRRGVRTVSQRREAIKNPASSAGPSRPRIAGRIRTKLDNCLTCIRNRPHFRVDTAKA